MVAEADAVPGGPDRTRLFVYNGGFLRDRRLRRILNLSGYDLRIGLPRPGDLVGVWGNSPTSHRAETVACKKAVGLIRVEDAFLRPIRPGRNAPKLANEQMTATVVATTSAQNRPSSGPATYPWRSMLIALPPG